MSPHKRSPARRYERYYNYLRKVRDIDESERKRVIKKLFQLQDIIKFTKINESPFYKYNSRSMLIDRVGYCTICNYDREEALEIHHKDGNHKNNSWKNIAVVCANCHRLLHKGAL